MSLYVVAENQELLWNVISKNIYIRDFFAPYNPEKKHEWFKTIIRSFYEKYKMQNLSVADLNTVNKETISYMMQNVRTQINEPVVKTTSPSYDQSKSHLISPPPIVQDTRQDIYAKEFEQRQQEYANLNKKHTPAHVDFTEKADDGVLQNMDELVKQQREQRAYEMSMIPSPVLPPPKLQIDTSSNIEISIEEVDKKPNKKGVTWKNDTETQDTIIEKMSQDIIELHKIVETIQMSMNELKQTHVELEMKYIALHTNQPTHTADPVVETMDAMVTQLAGM
jgi:hypothetical protein